MSDYIDKIKKNGVEYDIHDKRFDEGGTSSDVVEITDEDYSIDEHDDKVITNIEVATAIANNIQHIKMYGQVIRDCSIEQTVQNYIGSQDYYYLTLMQEVTDNGYGERMLVYKCDLYQDSGSSIGGVIGSFWAIFWQNDPESNVVYIGHMNVILNN